MSVDPTRPDVLSIDDQQKVAAWHDERGLYDYVTVGTGSYFEFTRLMPTFVYEEKLGPPWAERIRQAVRHAKVQSESHIRTPENADYVIASGQADMVSIVRGQIADPHMANKAREGRAEDVRPCLSCNQMCWGRRSRDYWVSCLVNPSAGREFEWGGDRFTRSESPRTVLVVGGVRPDSRRPGQRRNAATASSSPRRRTSWAGSSGSRGCSRAGPKSSISSTGTSASSRSSRSWYASTPRWTPTRWRGFDADVVVLATGSQPAGNGWQRGLPTVDRLPGVDGANVHSVEDVMSRAARPGHRVIVLDDTGTWRGGGTAWHLAERGHAVTIVTPDPFVGREIVRTSADWPLRERLKRLGVAFVVESAVKAWHGDGATVIDLLDESERRIDADALVLATVNAPERWLPDALAGSGREVHSIGDCVAARQAPAAIFEGRKLGLAL